MALASHDFLHKQETEDLTTSSWRNRRKNRLYTPGTQLKACTACHFSKRSVCFRSAYSRSFILSQSEPSKNSKSKCPGLKSVCSKKFQVRLAKRCLSPGSLLLSDFVVVLQGKGQTCHTLLWVSRFHDRPISRSRELATDFSRFLEK